MRCQIVLAADANYAPGLKATRNSVEQKRIGKTVQSFPIPTSAH